MSNPLVSQGVLNRLKASMVIPGFPALTTTSSFLGRLQIRLALEGNAVDYHDTSTGAVPSPNPYQRASATVHLLKTQALSALWKAQVETNALLGDVVFYPDVDPTLGGLPPYLFNNCAIQNPRDIAFDGNDPDWTVMIGGYYYVNSDLFN